MYGSLLQNSAGKYMALFFLRLFLFTVMLWQTFQANSQFVGLTFVFKTYLGDLMSFYSAQEIMLTIDEELMGGSFRYCAFLV